MRHAVATYAHGRVTPASYEHVQRGVQRACVDARQMPVVVADDLVDLEVPALDHLVVAHRKQVRMPVTGGPQARADAFPGPRRPMSEDATTKRPTPTEYCT